MSLAFTAFSVLCSQNAFATIVAPTDVECSINYLEYSRDAAGKIAETAKWSKPLTYDATKKGYFLSLMTPLGSVKQLDLQVFPDSIHFDDAKPRQTGLSIFTNHQEVRGNFSTFAPSTRRKLDPNNPWSNCQFNLTWFEQLKPPSLGLYSQRLTLYCVAPVAACEYDVTD